MAKLSKFKLTNNGQSVLFLGNSETYSTEIGTVLGVTVPTAAEVALPVAKIGALLNSSLASRVVVTTKDTASPPNTYTYQLVCANDRLATALGGGSSGLLTKKIDNRNIVTARQPTRRIFVD